MKKCLSLLISILLLVSLVPTAMIVSAAEYEYTTINNFNDSVYPENMVATAFTYSFEGNAGPDGSNALKLSNKPLTYTINSKGCVAKFPISQEQRENSLGIRIWLKGDASAFTNKYIEFWSDHLTAGTNTQYRTKNYVSLSTDGSYITFYWDDLSTEFVNSATGKAADPTTEQMQSNLNYIGILFSCAANTAADTAVLYVDDVELIKEKTVSTQYEVSLDGTPTLVDENSVYTFPELSKTGLAYTDGTNYYNVGDQVTVNSNLTFTTLDLDLSMQNGAAMRYTIISGMRYYTNFNTQVYDKLVAAGADITIGTLIAPYSWLNGEELTLDIDIESRINVLYQAKEWYSPNVFVGSIANVKYKNVKLDFVGRGYATVEFNGVTKTVYASYYDSNVANNTRQIGWIAKQIVEYSTEYGTLTDAQKEVVNKYYNLYNA